MPLPDWTRNRRRLALAAAVVFAVAVALALIVLGSGREAPAPAPPGDPGPRPLEINPPPLPIPPPPLSRAELDAAATRAAAAQAAGDPPTADQALVGRRFLVRIPFGCEGPQTNGADRPAYWEHDAKRETITLRAHPEDWTTAGWVRLLAGAPSIDAVEGFWLPAVVSEDCPSADATVPEEGALGLAMFFEPNSSRLMRRGSQPYEFVGKAPADTPIAPAGFRLLLAGRVEGFDGEEPVRCRKDSPPDRPVCLLAVTFDQVAFEDPATGRTLAEWRLN